MAFPSIFHQQAHSMFFICRPRRTALGSGPLLSRSLSYAPIVPPSSNLERLLEEETSGMARIGELKRKVELLGIKCDDFCVPGRFNHLFCPKCRGGKSIGRTLSLHIVQEGDSAIWRCFQTNCGWAGQAFADSNKILLQGVALQPLGHKLIAYFAKRNITEETLRRNGVMQKNGDQAVIAFTYRRNGVLVGCKYRTMEKIFWQEKGTKKWLYGLDDISEASEVILVEGEIDKLSMEEAGFRNCVSVPCGAPQKASAKELPALEKELGIEPQPSRTPPQEEEASDQLGFLNHCVMDLAYQYLWNCKSYLDKMSRVILATDADEPGKALAEELARRLGKERCWHVRWPKKDHFSYFKDANEVLGFLGPGALKEVIENAEKYQENVQDIHDSSTTS